MNGIINTSTALPDGLSFNDMALAVTILDAMSLRRAAAEMSAEFVGCDPWGVQSSHAVNCVHHLDVVCGSGELHELLEGMDVDTFALRPAVADWRSWGADADRFDRPHARYRHLAELIKRLSTLMAAAGLQVGNIDDAAYYAAEIGA